MQTIAYGECYSGKQPGMLPKDLLEKVEACTALLAVKGLTISFAESATAGSLSYAFSQANNAGQVLKGGLVCYDACLKEDILGIPREMIGMHTPESAEVTREMALRLAVLIDADITVAITGLTRAGGSEQPGKPVGTMFYCILSGGKITERKKIFTGEPEEIIWHTIDQILKTITHLIEQKERHAEK